MNRFTDQTHSSPPLPSPARRSCRFVLVCHTIWSDNRDEAGRSTTAVAEADDASDLVCPLSLRSPHRLCMHAPLVRRARAWFGAMESSAVGAFGKILRHRRLEGFRHVRPTRDLLFPLVPHFRCSFPQFCPFFLFCSILTNVAY
jgi:hypothetical protein